MWCLLVMSLVLWWSSQTTAAGEAVDVSCRDAQGNKVDWFILYKTEKTPQTSIPPKPKLTGEKFVYIDKSGPKKMPNIREGVLPNTLHPMLRSVRKMPDSFGFISYSDQPPRLLNSDHGHSKGVVMGDSETKTALWLTHSTPQFPLRRDPTQFWPPNGYLNSQTFMCVSLTYDDLKVVGTHLQNIWALPFDYDLPDHFPKELRETVDKAFSNGVDVTKMGKIQNLQTINNQQNNQPSLMAFAKKNVKLSKDPNTNKPREKLLPNELNDGDLYTQLAVHFKSHIKAQTWKRGTANVKYENYNVINIEMVKTDVGAWDKCKDHSKWAVTTSANVHWTCICDSNREDSQSKRPGGALCINSEEVTDIFKGFISGTEDNGVVPAAAAPPGPAAAPQGPAAAPQGPAALSPAKRPCPDSDGSDDNSDE